MRIFYKSPESAMLRIIYLIVITDQLRTTTSRSDQSHETNISRCLQSCRVLTRCWRPTSLSLTLLRLPSHTSHHNLIKAQNSSKSHANWLARQATFLQVTQPLLTSRNPISIKSPYEYEPQSHQSNEICCEWRKRGLIRSGSNQGGRSCAGARVAPAEKFGFGRKF